MTRALRTARASLVLRGVGLAVVDDGDEDPIVRLVSAFLLRKPTWLSALGQGVSEEYALWAVQWLVARSVPEENSYWMVGHCMNEYTPMDRAAKRGFLSVVAFLHEHSAAGCTEYAMEYAARNGHTDVVKFLHEHRCEGALGAAIYHAAKNGVLDLVQYLHETAQQHLTADMLICYGNVEVLKYVHSRLPPSAIAQNKSRMVSFMNSAVVSGKMDVVTWFHENVPEARSCSQRDFRLATFLENHDVVRFLLDQQYPLDYASAMDDAAGFDDLEMIKIFHEMSSAGCTTKALDNAAASGSLEIVRFLHEQRREGCTTSAMDEAAANGHLDVVRYLHEHRTEGCTTAAMDGAAQNGHLAIVRFLTEHREEGCTIAALDGAAGQGHMEVVKYLSENMSEAYTAPEVVTGKVHGEAIQLLGRNPRAGCTTDAMDKAAENGHLEVLKFLHKHRDEGCTNAALASAALHGHAEVVRYLCEMCGCNQFLDQAVMEACIRKQWFELLRYLHRRRLMDLEPEAFLLAIMYDQAEMIEYMYNQCIAILPDDQKKQLMREAFEKAAKKKLNHVVVLLDSKRFEGEAFSNDAIRIASLCGHIDTAEYLLTHGHEGSTVALMDLAAARGRIDLVRFLHENRSDGCTCKAMDWAATYGHLDVVRFLHENRSEGCTSKAMTLSAHRGHLNVVQFLHENRSEGCTEQAIDLAAKEGHLDVVFFLHENRTEGCIQRAVRGAHQSIAEAMASLRCRRPYCSHGWPDPTTDAILPWNDSDY